MKELILIRHAKSDWANEAIKDIDRHLNDRGYADAYQLSQWYKSEFTLPDLLLSSPATRAINTAFIFARTFGIPEAQVMVSGDLYESTMQDYLEVISKLDKKYNRVMLFGHNPAITNLTNELNKDLLFENVPTCGIIKIGFPYENWKEVADKKHGQLLLNKFPKSFK
ncbi:MAG TPA: histidine phosphatase family protein [Bacteroidia bacterium]|nr:histidine phosphatase family protein [Bacteroidia bacterium]HRD40008.1 histidine phosphatase family protein [Bacteroidia bacterium]